jgi:phosphatidylserine decarboxylase
MRDALLVSMLSILPRNRGAAAMGAVARSPLSRLITRLFVWTYGVDMSEAEQPLSAYPTLEALFTRRLREGARPIDARPDVLVSPCDGTVAFAGTTRGGVFDVAPGRPLSLQALRGDGSDEADVLVIYLSPTDYHRVHAPAAGDVVHRDYRAGTLWPVFPGAVARVPELFARNERVVVRQSTAHGPLDVVLIGAFGVGRIGLAFEDLLTNAGHAPGLRTFTPTPHLARGDELGVFHLGSTVVLVGEPGSWTSLVSVGSSVRMGQALARYPGADAQT